MSDYLGQNLIGIRRQTILRLNDLADDIDKINRDSKIARLSGTTASVVGAAAGVPLSIAAIVCTGGTAAVPLGIAAGVFAGVGGAGGVTSFGANLGGHYHVKSKYEEAVAAVEEDRALGQQYLDYVKIARGAVAAIGGGAFVVNQGVRIARNVFATSADALEAVAKVSKVAGRIGIVVSIVLLPIDLYDLVKNSISIHTEESHAMAEEIRGWADRMQRELPELERFVNDQ